VVSEKLFKRFTLARKTLVLFDTLDIRKEVVRYATGLAKRTESELMLLIILHPNSRNIEDQITAGDKEWENAGREALTPHLLDIEGEGVQVTAEVLIGDPPSELLKFMAKNHPFQTIVWGGAETVVKAKSSKMEGHWLGQLKNKIDCPLVVPTVKS